MVIAALAVELVGRKAPMAGGLALSGAAILGLLAAPATWLMFLARAGVMAAFTVLFIYTPEVSPRVCGSREVCRSKRMRRVWLPQ